MINEKRILDTFFEYVQIDSESFNEKAMAEKIMADFKELGCEVYMDKAGETCGSNGGNVYCTLKGTGDKGALILSSHMDTVKPGNGIEPVLCDDGFVRSKGNTILASDDKSGIVSILEAMRTVVENNVPHRTIEAVFTICEEVGMFGARNLDYNKITGKDALVFDSSGDVGKIITSAPGQIKLDIDIIGKSAHAGVAPEEGISAIQVAAEAVSNMKLLRIDEETTANIGTFTASYATNIVAERVKVIAEARSRNDDKLAVQSDHMMKCFTDACEKYGATYEGGVKPSYSAYHVDADDALISEIKIACKAIGVEASLAASGGGSDANQMNLNGVKAVVMGTGMSKVHTTDEEIAVKNLNNCAKLIIEMVKA